MHLYELKQLLNQLFPMVPNDFCPNGLQIEGSEHVTEIATAVTADPQTIYRAVDLGVHALIVHHGLFWQKDSYVIEGAKKEKIKLLIENGISLFAYHLPMDLHTLIGNNWKAAQDMGWKDLQPFGISSGLPIGVKGIIHPI